MPRSLYECFHAKVKDGHIHCAKGHKLPNSSLKPLESGLRWSTRFVRNAWTSPHGESNSSQTQGWNNAGQTV
jgi:hypothetical protein